MTPAIATIPFFNARPDLEYKINHFKKLRRDLPNGY